MPRSRAALALGVLAVASAASVALGTGSGRSDVLATLNNCCPAWSHDGRWIAFCRLPLQNTRGPYGIFLVRPDGSQVRRLPTAGCEQSPSWSPGDTSLAFTSGAEVLVVRRDGRGLRTLSPYAQTPAWGPRGRRIAFAMGRAFLGEPQKVYVIRPDGTDLRLVSRGRGGGRDADYPTWSRDGNRIAFAVWGPPGAEPYGFGFARSFGGVTTYVRPDVVAQELDWSPTRDEIAFNTAGPPEEGRIGLLDPRSGRIRFIGRGFAPSWSPDGSRLVFSRDGAIYVMSRAGSNVRRVVP